MYITPPNLTLAFWIWVGGFVSDVPCSGINLGVFDFLFLVVPLFPWILGCCCWHKESSFQHLNGGTFWYEHGNWTDINNSNLRQWIVTWFQSLLLEEAKKDVKLRFMFVNFFKKWFKHRIQASSTTKWAARHYSQEMNAMKDNSFTLIMLSKTIV